LEAEPFAASRSPEQFLRSETQTAMSAVPPAPLPFPDKGNIMNYLILFSTAAVAGIYLLIIWECLKHPEW
jgi:hypothetical protein